ncbi:MAG: universal stress protein [Acidobacteria bacterium]|nr:MAG: universal stress protein [Acidobacteriota bacterium]
MIDIKRILCPVDFSEFSRHALEHAVMLARWYDSTVTVFHAYPLATLPMIFAGDPSGSAVSPTSTPGELREEAVAQLASFAAAVQPTGVRVSLEARPGNAVPNILDLAQSLSSDLIVIGTYGRSGIDRLILGSVTEKVLRKSPCPVMTVPPPVSAPSESALVLFKRILCAIDFSDPSTKALELALSLAQEANAELLILHVIEGVPDTQHWKQGDPTLLRYILDAEADASRQLRESISSEARNWCKPVELLTTGKAYREILRVARERDVHLIVMGVHGRNPVDLMFFGSTTHHVIRSATCPVLTLRG